MFSGLFLDHLIFSFFGALGVLQLVFGLNGIRGMLFVRSAPRVSALLGVLLVVYAFTWFFGGENRQVPDTAGGMDGNAQIRSLALAAAAALFITAVVSSLINHRWSRQPTTLFAGVTALQATTYAQAVATTFMAIWRWVRAWTVKLSSG